MRDTEPGGNIVTETDSTIGKGPDVLSDPLGSSNLDHSRRHEYNRPGRCCNHRQNRVLMLPQDSEPALPEVLRRLFADHSLVSPPLDRIFRYYILLFSAILFTKLTTNVLVKEQ